MDWLAGSNVRLSNLGGTWFSVLITLAFIALVVGFIVPVNFGGVPQLKADFIVIEQQSYSSRFVRQAWAAGYNVIVWTVDDEQQMRDYMNAAVDGIITDRPDLGIAARTDIAEDKGLAGRLSDAIARSASF